MAAAPATDPTAAADPRAEHLGFLLVRAAERFVGATRDGLQPLGLTPRTYGALRVIAAHGPASQIALAERIGVDRTTMVAMLDALEALGVVARTPHPTDRRAHVIVATPSGHAVLRDAIPVVEAVEARLAGALAPDARVLVLRALRALVAT